MPDHNKQLEDKGWEAMRSLLDQELPQKKRSKRGLYWLLGLAGLLIVGKVTSHVFYPPHTPTKEHRPSDNLAHHTATKNDRSTSTYHHNTAQISPKDSIVIKTKPLLSEKSYPDLPSNTVHNHLQNHSSTTQHKKEQNQPQKQSSFLRLSTDVAPSPASDSEEYGVIRDKAATSFKSNLPPKNESSNELPNPSTPEKSTEKLRPESGQDEWGRSVIDITSLVSISSEYVLRSETRSDFSKIPMIEPLQNDQRWSLYAGLGSGLQLALGQNINASAHLGARYGNQRVQGFFEASIHRQYYRNGIDQNINIDVEATGVTLGGENFFPNELVDLQGNVIATYDVLDQPMIDINKITSFGLAAGVRCSLIGKIGLETSLGLDMPFDIENTNIRFIADEEEFASNFQRFDIESSYVERSNQYPRTRYTYGFSLYYGIHEQWNINLGYKGLIQNSPSTFEKSNIAGELDLNNYGLTSNKTNVFDASVLHGMNIKLQYRF